MLRGLLWKEAFGLHIEEENQDLKSYSTENSEEPYCQMATLYPGSITAYQRFHANTTEEAKIRSISALDPLYVEI